MQVFKYFYNKPRLILTRIKLITMKKIVFLLLFSYSIAFAQIERAEPPFWWSGMHKPELQIMFYGKNIAQYNPEVGNAVIKNVVKTENPNYLFVTIDTREVPAGDLVFSFKDKKNKTAFTQKYTLKNRKQNSAQR